MCHARGENSCRRRTEVREKREYMKELDHKHIIYFTNTVFDTDKAIWKKIEKMEGSYIVAENTRSLYEKEHDIARQLEENGYKIINMPLDKGIFSFDPISFFISRYLSCCKLDGDANDAITGSEYFKKIVGFLFEYTGLSEIYSESFFKRACMELLHTSACAVLKMILDEKKLTDVTAYDFISCFAEQNIFAKSVCYDEMTAQEREICLRIKNSMARCNEYLGGLRKGLRKNFRLKELSAQIPKSKHKQFLLRIQYCNNEPCIARYLVDCFWSSIHLYNKGAKERVQFLCIENADTFLYTKCIEELARVGAGNKMFLFTVFRIDHSEHLQRYYMLTEMYENAPSVIQNKLSLAWRKDMFLG